MTLSTVVGLFIDNI